MVEKNMIAIIPARGGSKRIPKKNIKEFLGKPMIAWTIEAAKNTKKFDRIFVSTDDAEIAVIAKEYGAEVPFLRDEFADDFSTVSQVTVYTLKEIEKRLGESYKTVVQLMPNCPLRTDKSIIESLSNFSEKGLAFQLSCFQFGWNNPWWACKLSESGVPSKLFPEDSKKRSQDLPDLYCPTGAIWIANVQSLYKSNDFYGPDYRFHPMSWLESVDIDTYEDWIIAEKLVR